MPDFKSSALAMGFGGVHQSPPIMACHTRTSRTIALLGKFETSELGDLNDKYTFAA
jgi:hypothetical protein